mgnify:CR=1 FL=1
MRRRIGDFGGDNRAGIERTLHRISAIRNRSGRVVGLTCRVGRAVFGTIEILRDHIESGRSILIMGRPGVGKTTITTNLASYFAAFGVATTIADYDPQSSSLNWLAQRSAEARPFSREKSSIWFCRPCWLAIASPAGKSPVWATAVCWDNA